MTATISLSMIVRDEAERLAASLESAQPYVDEIIIVDTGSTDRTLEIARKYTDKVFSIAWEGDFSAARNFAKSHCSGDWVLSLDADERLDCRNGTLQEALAAAGEHSLCFLPLVSQNVDCAQEYDRFMVLRLFRNRQEHAFFGKIHEQMMIPDPNAVFFAATPVIVHTAVPQRQRNRKRHRNLTLLKQAISAEPNNIFLRYYLAVEWLGLKRYALALPILQSVVAELGDEQILFRAPAIRYLIACLTATGRNDDALRLCINESLRYPAYSDLFFDAGVLLEQRGDHASAIRHFQTAIQCGLPPAIFNHTCGAESYLALYHLGRCYERTGRFETAANCFRQALAANPEYLYPLPRLCLLAMTNLPARAVYEQLRSDGFLSRDNWNSIIAGLLFEAGYPELAAACGDEATAAGNRHNFIQFKYLVYCGRLAEALALEQNLPRLPEEPPDFVLDAFAASLLNGNAKAARTKALKLWRRSGGRGPALALLNLASLYENSKTCCSPEKSQYAEYSQTVLYIVEHCLRYRNHAQDDQPASTYRRLAVCGLTLLTGLPDSGCQTVAAYWQAKADYAVQLLNQRNFPAGRLYL